MMPIDVQSELIAILATPEATIGLLHRCLQEGIFVVLQEATTLTFFSIVSQGRKGLIVIANCLLQEATMTRIVFFMLY